MPNENNRLRGDLDFAYRVFRPEDGNDAVVMLLHGSGVDETTLLPLGRAIAPAATLIAVRGRVPQETGWRWFERITPTRFDQASIRSETALFARFVESLARREGFRPEQALFLGYSNGANLVSSLMLLHPGLVRRAALLRAMPVLDDGPATDLTGTDVLILAGENDATYGPCAPALAALLRGRGAQVEAHTVPLGHEFGAPDEALVRRWLAQPAGA